MKNQYQNIKKLLDSNEFEEKIKKEGWRKISAGETTFVKLDERFTLIARRSELGNILKKIEDGKQGKLNNSEKKELTENTEDKSLSNGVEKTDRISSDSSTKNGNHPKWTFMKTMKIANIQQFKDIFEKKKQVIEHVKSGEVKSISRNKGYRKLLKINDLQQVSKPPVGAQKSISTPTPSNDDLLPSISNFENYESLLKIKSDKKSLVIACDTEFFYPDGPENERKMLSWQFALVDDQDFLWEFVFFKRLLEYDLPLEIALGRIFDLLKMIPYDSDKYQKYFVLGDIDPTTGDRENLCFRKRSDAIASSRAFFDDGKQVHKAPDWEGIDHLSVTLLCHAGKVDVTSFYCYTKYLRKCIEVQGGVVTDRPFKAYPKSLKCGANHHSYRYPILLSIRDTMCHAPAGKKKLEDLGQVVGINKIDISVHTKNHMDLFLLKNPVAFARYASRDSVVTLLYAAALYGYNHEIKITLTSAAASIVRSSMMTYLECPDKKTFEEIYRGLVKTSHGLVPLEDKPGYIETSSLEPITHAANIIQNVASQAYHGGYNGCFAVGFYDERTYDYDLRDAYPTAMCLVPDIYWPDPIYHQIHDRYLSMKDFMIPGIGLSPLIPMLGYVVFEFPENVDCPCIPIMDAGRLIYTRTSDGLHGVYACGPELYLALKLGAKIYAKDVYVLRSLVRADGSESYSTRFAVKKIVEDRHRAQKICGKKSLEDLLLKTMVNSVYGKTAQNVIQKNTWSAVTQEMENIGCSYITNPVLASLTTSIVRAELLAVLNESSLLGYQAYSVTTDGFITNMPADVLCQLEMFGFRKEIEKARLYLTDQKDPCLWLEKHRQDDLLNFTTRGNLSLSQNGVCAHNSFKSNFESGSYEDRLYLYKKVLDRTGRISCSIDEWPRFKDLCAEKPFIIRRVTKDLSMDFDLKRKPVQSSIRSVFPVVNGEKYEIANFQTRPFESVSEFRKFDKKKKEAVVLRTKSDLDLLFAKIQDKGHHKIHDLEWSRLMSCVIGHRHKIFNIPMLDLLAGRKRIDWINSFNDSKRLFNADSWKNAGRHGKDSSMLEFCLFEDLLKRMCECGG